MGLDATNRLGWRPGCDFNALGLVEVLWWLWRGRGVEGSRDSGTVLRPESETAASNGLLVVTAASRTVTHGSGGAGSPFRAPFPPLSIPKNCPPSSQLLAATCDSISKIKSKWAAKRMQPIPPLRWSLNY